MSTFEEALEVAVKAAVLRAHPVGSYFITESADNPAEIFGGGGMAKIGRACPARHKFVLLGGNGRGRSESHA